jgi:hypothetical protein
VINGMTAALGDHAIYLELLVGVAGFEPAASSSRTKRAVSQKGQVTASAQVSDLRKDTITASEVV